MVDEFVFASLAMLATRWNQFRILRLRVAARGDSASLTRSKYQRTKSPYQTSCWGKAVLVRSTLVTTSVEMLHARCERILYERVISPAVPSHVGAFP